MMNILIAPNAFKHALDASAAALAIQEGLMQSRLDCTCACFPVADGGDGTADLIIQRRGGEYVHAETCDALGRPVDGSFGLIDEGKTAVIEMANASGIRLLKHEELSPLHALSFGTGLQMKAALDRGVQKMVIAMGGSATVDGGCGILKALGARFLDADQQELNHLPVGLSELASTDVDQLDNRLLRCEIVVLCDVHNRLLGSEGAAAVFGPQKGASEPDVKKLDAALSRFAQVAFRQTGKDLTSIKYGGTAGGAAAGLYAYAHAQLVNGIDYFLDMTGFDAALAKADFVITGEGSIDEQTLQGKAPYGVARRAKRLQIPVIALAGKVPIHQHVDLEKCFNAILPISHEPVDLQTALASTQNNLTRTARALGNILSLRNSGMFKR